jgi:hypothetical protein
MRNRFGTDIKRGDLVSDHTSRVETSAGSCGVNDVIKSTRVFLRKGCQIEVGTGRPGYRWVQGWQTLDPETGAWSAEMRRADAVAMVAQMRMRHA